MARIWDRVVITPDRGDGKPFIQVEWTDEFGQAHSREVADLVTPGLSKALQQHARTLKGMVEANEV